MGKGSLLYEGRSLCRTYRRGDSVIRAVDNLTLSVAEGESIAVIGPSGSGKTTLLHILALLDGEFEGQFFFLGQDISSASSKERAALRRKEIGIVFQGFHLLGSLNVLDNVALPCWRLYGRRAVARKRAADLLDSLGMGHRLLHRVTRLSAGEMQRVAIARALINEPKVILADEPTGNLDAQSTASVLELFTRIVQKGRTLVMITHDPEVRQTARRVISLRYGQLAALPTHGLTGIQS